MLLALLLTLTAWAGVVVEPLHESGSGYFDAEFMTLPDGRVAVVHRPGGIVGSAWTLLPEGEAWRALRSPGGAIVAAEDGLHSVFAWPDPVSGGRHYHLQGDRWVALEPLPELPAASGVLALQVEGGAVEAWVSNAGVALRLTQTAGGWADETLGYAIAWDDDGEVFVQTEAHVQGRRKWRAPKVSDGAALSFDESPDGQPAFVAVEDSRLRLWFAGEAVEVELPGSQTIDRRSCVDAPCEEVIVYHTAPRSGRLAFEGGRPVVPLVRTTATAQLTCHAMPMHPCDPAGPINTCPTEPMYDCKGPREITHELLLLRPRGAEWRLELVDLPVNPLRVLDTRVVDGELWLLVEAGVPAQARSLQLVRVGAEGAPRPVQHPVAAAATPWSVDALNTAGFVPAQGSNNYVGWPVWGEGSLRTGGERYGPAWATLELPALSEPIRVEVSAEVAPWPSGCGEPDLRTWAFGRSLKLVLGGEQLVLINALDSAREEIDAPAHGAHTWALALWPDAVAVEVDGEEVHRQPLREGPDGYANVSVGQLQSCGVPVGPEVTWTGVSVRPISEE